MKAKLDESLGKRGLHVLREDGWDVSTVVDEDLCGATDASLIDVCRAESRVLVTLDKDFANTLRFRPSCYAGLIVLRLPNPLRPQDMCSALSRIVVLAKTRSPVGRLWIVDLARIREYVEEDSKASE